MEVRHLVWWIRRMHAVLVLILFTCTAHPQSSRMPSSSAPSQDTPFPTARDDSGSDVDQQSERELQAGSALTRRGEFTQAIPHLLAARGRVGNEYAAEFNLGICYVATDQPHEAIPILIDLRNRGHDNADVNNLLAQAYVGDSQDEKVLDALKRAASFTPANEKLYMFVADACMGKQS